MIIPKYHRLYNEALEISSRINDLCTYAKNSHELMLKLIQFSTDPKTEEFSRLIVTLMYVNNPNDKNLVANLTEYIKEHQEHGLKK